MEMQSHLPNLQKPQPEPPVSPLVSRQASYKLLTAGSFCDGGIQMCIVMLHQNLGFAYLMVGKSFKKNNIFLPQKGDDLVMAKESKQIHRVIPSPALTKKKDSRH